MSPGASHEHSALTVLADRARLDPDRLLLDGPGGTRSYGEFIDLAAATASRLVDSGLRPGGHVAIHAAEPDLFFAGLLGSWLAGSVAVPLNSSLPANQLLRLVRKARCALVLTGDPGRSPFDPVPALAIPRTGAAFPGPDPGRTTGSGGLGAIVFTSGTTGVPKGVCQSIAALSRNAALAGAALGLGEADRLFVNTPPYYMSGICHFLAVIAAGASLVFRSGFRFADALLSEIRDTGATAFGGAPAHLVRVVEPLDAPSAPDRLRLWMSSGDFLPPRVVAKAQTVLPGVGLFNVYGLTEVAGRLCILPPEELRERPGSVGRPIGGMRLTIRRPDDSPAAPGEEGELHVDGPLLSSGYFDEPELTSRSWGPNGFRTGDFGHMDADGFFYPAGRRDDVFKRGGEKVSTLEIQQALLSLGAFSDVSVLAVEDEMLGRVPVAFVVPRDEGSFRRSAVLRALRDLLPPPSVPARVLALPSIPRTGSGKAVRSELLALLRETRG
jgi:acyl-CoA synthetase (AMP-forming)/AMP-acid ligase II